MFLISVNLHPSVYIPSVESSDIYDYNFRDRKLKLNFVGMIPSSLELNKLIEIANIKIKKKKDSTRMSTEDIFSVSFEKRVDSALDLSSRLKVKIPTTENEKYKEKLIDFVDLLDKEKDNEHWRGIKVSELREIFYNEGFMYKGHKYIVYKRSSAKSRIGQCLFIKEKFHAKMMKWCRMGIDFNKFKSEDKVDYPSLLAYESLVGSSIESTIEINPDNILIVEDVDSVFYQRANAIRTNPENGFLDSFPEDECKVVNSIFDGESLLDHSLFTNGKSMMLLRNHMFKSAAFNCNIQQFLKDNCPENIKYEEWQLDSMFKKEKIYAKDVKLIITPNSLKVFKFSHTISNTKNKDYDMWKHWKNTVKKDGNVFGVCKSEKSSKRGFNDNGEILQQTSYQMLNSLPIKEKDIEELTKLEIDYITKLKNDDEFFMNYIYENINISNANEMFCEIYKRNKKIINTKMFKEFRKRNISSYVNHVKRGKIKLQGDYCVMLGNPIEFLFHAIGKLDVDNLKSMSLHNNEIYTTLFEECDLVGFRNPHTSPNNVLYAKNVHNSDIDKYLNLTKNIVCVNSIAFAIQDILSSADFDSDSVLLLRNNTITQLSYNLSNEYNICINQVNSEKKWYDINNHSMYLIDSELSNSQRYIGQTVNVGQLCMSRYWDLVNNGRDKDSIDIMMKKVDVVTVLSSICIDLAKKMFDINITKEINNIKREEVLGDTKPLFWKYVASKKIKNNIREYYNCPMDMLFHKMSDLDYGERKETVSLDSLLKKDINKNLGDRQQPDKIIEDVTAFSKAVGYFYNDKMMNDDEKRRNVEFYTESCILKIKRMKIRTETIYSLVYNVAQNKYDGIALRLLDAIFKAKKDDFLYVFEEISTND